MNTHLTTPIGGYLTDEEMRALEAHHGIVKGRLMKVKRTGPNEVSIEAVFTPVSEITITVEVPK